MGMLRPFRAFLCFMETTRPLRAMLCLYEVARLGVLVGALLTLQPGWAPLPLLAMIAPGALFLLMALFLLLDLTRYEAYGPLFLVGKGLSVVTVGVWLALMDINTIFEIPDFTEFRWALGTIMFLGPFDVLSACMAAAIIRRRKAPEGKARADLDFSGE